MKFYLTTLLLIFIWSCTHPIETENLIQGEAQGSTYHIKYIGKEIPNLKVSMDSILEVIDVSMSTYRDDSTISKINKGVEIAIDTHFENVFLMSQQIWKESRHLFDPTVGVLATAWGFGRNKQHQAPSEKAIDSLLQYVGFDKVYLDEKKIIHKENSNISFDFNAIAQGYSVDVLADFLKSKNIQNFIVEVGGELFIAGKNTITQQPWTIGIDNPLQSPEERSLIATVQLSDKAMATSGNYRKVWTDPETGQQYVHTINPVTGKTQPSDVLSVTVIAENAMKADGYATAFMVMGLKSTQEFLSNHPELDVYINYSSGNELESFATEGFKKLMVN